MALMEEAGSIALTPNIEIYKTFAIDYSQRYPKVYGKKLWVLVSGEVSTFKTPAQQIAANKTLGYLDISAAPQIYSALLNNEESFTASGYTLYGLLATRLWDKAPTDCPDWFIWVPWNPEFKTKNSFCVAQYEMTYEDAGIPNSNFWWTDWNTVAYVPWKKIITQAGKYPIADINQAEAIIACKSMWDWYHLMTNNEWMTIARNIEATKENWSSGTIWQWNLYNWVSIDTTLWCNAKWWNTDLRSFATKTWSGNISCNPRRTHALSQGGWIIWDLSGNVWEHVNKANTIDGSRFNTGQTTVAGSSGPTVWDDNWIYNLTDMKVYSAATLKWTAGGMWSIYYSQGLPNNIFIRWGSSWDWIYSGIFTLDMDDTTVYGYKNIGFRCVK